MQANYVSFKQSLHAWRSQPPHKGLTKQRLLALKSPLFERRDICFPFSWPFLYLCIREIQPFGSALHLALLR